MEKDELAELIQTSINSLDRIEDKQYQLSDLLEQIRPFVPGIVNRIQGKMPISLG